jgi:hypothetical protein
MRYRIEFDCEPDEQEAVIDNLPSLIAEGRVTVEEVDDEGDEEPYIEAWHGWIKVWLDYGTTVSAQGRNGRMKCIGLEVMTGETLQMGPSFLPVVKFAPINTQGVGNCEIEVPVAKIDDLIQLLQRCKP